MSEKPVIVFCAGTNSYFNGVGWVEDPDHAQWLSPSTAVQVVNEMTAADAEVGTATFPLEIMGWEEARCWYPSRM